MERGSQYIMSSGPNPKGSTNSSTSSPGPNHFKTRIHDAYDEGPTFNQKWVHRSSSDDSTKSNADDDESLNGDRAIDGQARQETSQRAASYEGPDPSLTASGFFSSMFRDGSIGKLDLGAPTPAPTPSSTIRLEDLSGSEKVAVVGTREPGAASSEGFLLHNEQAPNVSSSYIVGVDSLLPLSEALSTTGKGR